MSTARQVYRFPSSAIDGARAPMLWRDAFMWSIVLCGLGAAIVLSGIQKAIDFLIDLTLFSVLTVGTVTTAVAAALYLINRWRAKRANAQCAEGLEAIRSVLLKETGSSINDGVIIHIIEGRQLVLHDGRSVWSQRHGNEIAFMVRDNKPA